VFDSVRSYDISSVDYQVYSLVRFRAVVDKGGESEC